MSQSLLIYCLSEIREKGSYPDGFQIGTVFAFIRRCLKVFCLSKDYESWLLTSLARNKPLGGRSRIGRGSRDLGEIRGAKLF